jgi:hypothetical protein
MAAINRSIKVFTTAKQKYVYRLTIIIVVTVLIVMLILLSCLPELDFTACILNETVISKCPSWATVYKSDQWKGDLERETVELSS